MKDNCFDAGMIQAFTDGELRPELAESVARHVVICEDCARILAENEEESALAFSLLDEELNVLVPTERLRSKVFDSIRDIERESGAGWFGDLYAGIAGAFSIRNPALIALAASVLIVGTVAITVNILTGPVDPGAVAVNDGDADLVENALPVGTGQEVPVSYDSAGAQDSTAVVAANTGSRGARSRNQLAGTRNPGRQNNSLIGTRPIVVQNAAETVPVVTSEDSYLQTIATLDRTVEFGKESLRPSERIAFETDLAIVDDAIMKMKDEVRKNPDNQAAREVLLASYQNKIDLMNSVAEKTELMASLQ